MGDSLVCDWTIILMMQMEIKLFKDVIIQTVDFAKLNQLIEKLTILPKLNINPRDQKVQKAPPELLSVNNFKSTANHKEHNIRTIQH